MSTLPSHLFGACCRDFSRLVVLAGLASALVGCAGPIAAANKKVEVAPIEASDEVPRGSWVGSWRTTWGSLDTVSDGKKILGAFSYLYEGQERVGILIGEPKGNQLIVRWSEQKGADKGLAKLVLAADGSEFSGIFGFETSDSDGGIWCGVRSDE